MPDIDYTWSIYEKNKKNMNSKLPNCTEVRFSSFFSGGFITAIVVNPPERKLAKHTSVQFFLFSGQVLALSYCFYTSLLDLCCISRLYYIQSSPTYFVLKLRH